MKKMLHQNCIKGVYPLSCINRFNVLVDKIPWNVAFPGYKPKEYTASIVNSKIWADPNITDKTFSPQWNCVDENVNRQSFMGYYTLDEQGYPLNPIGRTGLKGRGLLGRWGPNHAADPIITRWKRNGTGALEIDRVTGKPILQFVSILRCDSGKWAIPGGMVDGDETISTTLKREFIEETMNALNKSETELQWLKTLVENFFEHGKEIYKGYVDDPRNTDNAWIETFVMNFHDDNGNTVANMILEAGDDAANVQWTDIDRQLKLYANHVEFIQEVAYFRNAHW
ncbi:ADP-ribose pyrophosphatase, mitochondrial [Venturia canescens]|uniref:ADP-ribose pyrophosphatase, mitochondrial n=1 Tax=Venturia canescens TaxID=32260 RepID=UPI001C9BDDF9|nr:ADP-ribose pyrophosphatase, mitochondrial [Venturia canescens]